MKTELMQHLSVFSDALESEGFSIALTKNPLFDAGIVCDDVEGVVFVLPGHDEIPYNEFSQKLKAIANKARLNIVFRSGEIPCSVVLSEA